MSDETHDESETPKKRGAIENLKPFQWKKGQTGRKGNPHETPPEFKLMRRLTKAELVEVGELIIMGDIATLKKLRTNDKCTVLKGMFISVCLKILRDGDMEKFDKLMSRFVGKVKDEIDVNHGAVGKVLVMLPSNGRETPK